MKKLMFAVAAMSAFAVVAADAAKSAKPAAESEKAEPEVEQQEKSIFSGFANYGIYSGYQLYGSIVNTEPTLQGYAEVNAALSWDDLDLGQFGVGVWNNSDLTGKRTDNYRRAFNEFDFNLHWQRMFWLDDDKTWGLFYRTYVVWYYYPRSSNRRPVNHVTFDWDHYFELTNPYAIPYINVVHEYLKSYGNLLQFGVKKPFQITDEFSLTPFIEFVWRDNRYDWCFSNYGVYGDGSKIDAGLATMKLELDATYMFTKNFGVFAKVAYCQNLSSQLRDAANYANGPYGYDAAYGRYNEFVWGGVGVCFSF